MGVQPVLEQARGGIADRKQENGDENSRDRDARAAYLETEQRLPQPARYVLPVEAPEQHDERDGCEERRRLEQQRHRQSEASPTGFVELEPRQQPLARCVKPVRR
jgi:hypothetical protein